MCRELLGPFATSSVQNVIVPAVVSNPRFEIISPLSSPAFDSLLFLTGPPGTGKSHIARMLCKYLLSARKNYKVATSASSLLGSCIYSIFVPYVCLLFLIFFIISNRFFWWHIRIYRWITCVRDASSFFQWANETCWDWVQGAPSLILSRLLATRRRRPSLLWKLVGKSWLWKVSKEKERNRKSIVAKWQRSWNLILDLL